MSPPPILPAAILETLLTGLASLFLAGANGDTTAARQAASHMLATYQPQSEDELRLAASIIGFSFQALHALGQAAAPDLAFTRGLRLRGSAVSLSREANKAERRLAQLQKARQRPLPAQTAETQPEPAQPQPKIKTPPANIQPVGKIAQTAKANGITWTQAYEQRQREIRLAASLKRAEVRTAAPLNPAMAGAGANHLATAQAI